MYAGLIHYKFKPGIFEDAVKEWENMVMEEARKHKGFIKAQMFLNEETGEAFDIGFWETEEDAKNFEETGSFDLFKEGLKDYIIETPVRKRFKLATSV